MSTAQRQHNCGSRRDSDLHRVPPFRRNSGVARQGHAWIRVAVRSLRPAWHLRQRWRFHGRVGGEVGWICGCQVATDAIEIRVARSYEVTHRKPSRVRRASARADVESDPGRKDPPRLQRVARWRTAPSYCELEVSKRCGVGVDNRDVRAEQRGRCGGLLPQLVHQRRRHRALVEHGAVHGQCTHGHGLLAVVHFSN